MSDNPYADFVFGFGKNSGWSFRREAPEWPRDENGEKEQAVLLKETADSPADTDMVISFLASCGIPCFKYYDKDGAAGKVISGFSGYGASLYVPASMLDEARAVLDAPPMEEEEE